MRGAGDDCKIFIQFEKGKPMSSEFEKLAAELEILAKAQPSEEDKVLEAAKEAGVDTDDAGDPGDKDADKKSKDPVDDEDEDDEVLGKSFQVVGGDGSPVKAYDATSLIKSINERILGVESVLTEDKEHLGKSLSLMSDMLKAQADQIETLQKAVVNMSKQGVGRKAVLTVNERPASALAKSEPALTPQTFMAKANTAFNAGRISGKELTVCDVSLRHNEPIDGELLSRIFPD